LWGRAEVVGKPSDRRDDPKETSIILPQAEGGGYFPQVAVKLELHEAASHLPPY
jgi:hypothetical protein